MGVKLMDTAQELGAWPQAVHLRLTVASKMHTCTCTSNAYVPRGRHWLTPATH